MSTQTPQHPPTSFRAKHPRLRRELWIAGGALLTGLIVLPLLIYMAGQLTLGPYASGSGSLGAFIGDYYSGLVHGSGAVWWVVLGPYLFLALLRGVLLISRRYLRTA